MDRTQLIDLWFENHTSMTAEDNTFLTSVSERWDSDVKSISDEIRSDEKEKAIKQFEEERKELQNKITLQKMQTGTPGTRIFELLQKEDGLKVTDFQRKLDDLSEQQIRSALFNLMKNKKVDSSSSRPKVYFLKSKGDPQVAEMTKSLKTQKMSFMG